MNNPLKYIDPTGHDGWPWDWVKDKAEEGTEVIIEGAKTAGGAIVGAGQAVGGAVISVVQDTTTYGIEAAGSAWDFIEDSAVESVSTFANIAQAYEDASLDTISWAAEKVIPEGQTAGIGLNLQAICGPGVSGSFMLVMDGNGGVGLLYSGGGGGGLAASTGLQVQWTNANSVSELGGLTVQAGGSAGPVSAEVLAAKNGDEKYQGFNLGYSRGFPIGVYGVVEYGGVTRLR